MPENINSVDIEKEFQQYGKIISTNIGKGSGSITIECETKKMKYFQKKQSLQISGNTICAKIDYTKPIGTTFLFLNLAKFSQFYSSIVLL